MHLDIFHKKVLKPTKSIKKWSNKTQALFLTQVGELLEEGFTLQETLVFAKLLIPNQEQVIDKMMEQLLIGERFDEALHLVGYSDSICSQIYLSMSTGSFALSCRTIGQYLAQKDLQLKKLRQVLIYPCILIIFLVGMISAIRYLLLGQLQSMVQVESIKDHMMLYLIWNVFVHLPWIILSVSLFIGLVLVVAYVYWKNKTILKRLRLLTRLPIVGSLVRQYYTFLYAREFAYFLGNGQSLLQMIEQMKQEGTSLLTKAIAEFIENEMQRGTSFSSAIHQLKLFQQPLILLIVQGELTHQLDIKLRQFSKNSFEDFKGKLEKKIMLIQPVLFIGIGLMIMSMYIILMLPTLTLIGGN